MTGGHIDAAKRFAMANRVRNDRRGRVAVAQKRLKTVGSEHFGSGQRKFTTEKSRVIT